MSTRVREHPFFKRKGDSVHCEVPVSVWEALRGARIRMPTPAGEASLVVPPGTAGRQVFRLRGQGLPRLADEGTGDLYVTLRVEMPDGARRADGRARARPRAADADGAARRASQRLPREARSDRPRARRST